MNFNFNDFLITFMSIIFEALPFIVLGAVISGALEEFLPQQFFASRLPKNRVLAIMVSSMMGIMLPMCECGIVAVMRRLLRKGVPASCAVTYMLSAPVINPIVLWSTGIAFWGFYDFLGVGGLGMVLLRGGLSFVTAVTVGLIIERLSRRNVPIVKEDAKRIRLIETDESKRLFEEENFLDGQQPQGDRDLDEHGHDESDDATVGPAEVPSVPKKSLLDRLTATADIALSDFLDIAAFLVIGAALAATVNTTLSMDTFERLAGHNTLSILAMMGFAVLLSLCSEADAFVAANFVQLSIGSKLAFLVVGPMFDIKLYIMYHWVFTKRIVWTIILTLFVVIFVLTRTVDFIALMVPESAGSLAG